MFKLVIEQAGQFFMGSKITVSKFSSAMCLILRHFDQCLVQKESNSHNVRISISDG